MTELESRIFQTLKRIEDNQKKIKTDIHNLTSIVATLAAETNMVKERIDLFVNQDFINQSLKELDAIKRRIG